MARDFTTAGTLGAATSAVSAAPFTIALWINAPSLTGATLIAVSDGSTNNRDLLQSSAAADPTNMNAASIAAGTGGATAVTTGSMLTGNAWHHWCGVFAAANDRRAYIDGDSKGTNSVSRGPTGLSLINLFATGAGAASTQRGLAAHLAIWNTALSDSDVALLGASLYAPSLVQPGSLVAYWPLAGNASPEPDTIGGNNMTLTGSVPQAADPPGILLSIPPASAMIAGAHPGKGKGRTVYDRPKRVILPNGDHVEVRTQEQYFRLMDDLIAGLEPQVPEAAVEQVATPSPKQQRRARRAAKAMSGTMRLDGAVEALVEQFVAEQEVITARKRTPTAGGSLAVYRLAPRARGIAADLAAEQQAIEVRAIIDAIRRRYQDDMDEEDAIMQAIGMLL